MEFRIKLISLTESLTRLANRLTSDKDDAKDLVQETFLKSLKHCDKFADDSNFIAWTSTILKNTFINNYRKSVRHNIYRDQTEALFICNRTIYTDNDNPDSEYSVKEITQNIEQLEDKFRIPFKMHLDGYKYKEIADDLTLNIGTVKSRIFFARRQLKENLIS